MGKELIREVMLSDDLTLGAAVDRSGGPGAGKDAGRIANMPEAGVLVSDRLSPKAGQVVIDFSLPQATDINIERCLSKGVPLILGTTGLTDASRSHLEDASKEIPIVFAANYSAGVTMLIHLSTIAARALGKDWQAEIFELHHKHKRDSPSGTGLRVASAVAEATRRDHESFVYDRSQREQPRAQDEIGVVAMRGGDSVGEHTLMLLGEGERLELTHRARDRAIFAKGALRAARWIVDRQPGLYDMFDVLGFGD
jgi:4-hydroxy-tetrahydrodipicolinate reductase